MPEHDSYSVYYDLLYENKQEDLPFYLDAAKETGGPVCELGCGTGRIVLPLARNGFEVTGLDMSQAMLSKLQAKPSTEPPRGDTSSVAGVALPTRRSTPAASPRPGGVRREQVMYNGVVWQLVHRTHRDLSQDSGSRTPVDEVYVEEPPRCPKCGLGVVETHSWLGYKWACPECGTRSRSQASIEQTARMLSRQK
jgi:SAM-dependent methyltransferase